MWEVHVLRQVQHPYIARLCDAIEFTDAVFVVMHRYEGPSLQQHIASQPSGQLSDADACRFFSQLLAAVRHAHSAGYLHCDIKPANVRLSAGCDHAVLVDWGMARSVHSQTQEGIARGTPVYASPEQLTGVNPEVAWGKPTLGPPVDVWSLGASLHEMAHGTLPFLGESFDELTANVMQLRYSSSGASVSAAVRELTSAMLQILPSERATVAELCEHSWVREGGHLPPPVPITNAASSGNGFLEGADVDGLLVGRRQGRLMPEAGAADRRGLLLRLLGFDPKQWGVTPLAIAMGVPASLSPVGLFVRRHRKALLAGLYALLIGYSAMWYSFVSSSSGAEVSMFVLESG